MLEGSWLPLAGLPILALVAFLRVRSGVSWQRAVLEAALLEYVLFVAAIVLFPMFVDPQLRADNGSLLANSGWWLNLVPLWSLYGLLKIATLFQVVRQVGIDVGLLLPLGILWPVLASRLRDWRVFTLSAVGVAAGIELVQLLERAVGLADGSVNIDDVLMGTFGMLVGYIVYRLAAAVVARRGLDYSSV